VSRTPTRIPLRLLILLAALVLVPTGLAACGDEDQDVKAIETTPADPGVSPEREGGDEGQSGDTSTTDTEATDSSASGDDNDADTAAPVANPTDAGERYARERLRVAEPREATELPSKRKPEWRLVSGFTDDGKSWAVFLRREGDGWVAVEGSSPAEPGPTEVPCDIRFPFSEPGC
jgi:hypothetical protein